MRPTRLAFVASCACFLAACDSGSSQLTIVVPTEAVDSSIVHELQTILESSSSVTLQLTSAPMSEEDALNAIAAGDADLAMVSNYLPFRDDIATVMPLYPTVLHVGMKNGTDNLTDLELPPDATVFAGPEGSASRIVFKRIAARMNLEPGDYRFVADAESAPDIVVVFTPISTENIEHIRGLKKWLPDFEILSMGTPAEIGTGNIIDAAVLLNPNFRPFVIPEGAYGDLTDKPIVTVAVDKMLVTRPGLDQTVVYDLINELLRLRPALAANRPGLFQALTGDFDASRSTYVLHAGAHAYVHRWAPNVYERYSGIAEVVVTILVALASATIATVRIYRMRRKNRIDEYYAKTIMLRRAAEATSEPDDLTQIVAEINKLQNDAFDQLIDEKLAANESFRIFVTLSNDVLGEIRQRLDLSAVSGQPEMR